MHLQIDALFKIKYLFYISEYKAKLIQLLVCLIYIYIYIYSTKSISSIVKSSNAIKTLTVLIHSYEFCLASVHL